MKKYFLLVLCMMALVGCRETVYETVYKTSNQSFTYQVKSWNYSNLVDQSGNPYANNYFYNRVDVPELTRDMVLNGNVQVYRVHNMNTQGEYMHILPEVQHFEELVDVVDMTYNFYTQTVDCIYGEGWIEFDVTMSDFFYENPDEISQRYAPEAMDFQVVLTK